MASVLLIARHCGKLTVSPIDAASGGGQDQRVTQNDIDRFYLELGRRVREARTEAGVTQAHLAEEIQMTRSSVANLEAGRQKIPLHLLFAIADTLGMEPERLLPAREPQAHLSLEGLDELSRRPLSSKDRSFLRTALRAAINKGMVDEAS